MSTLAIGSQDFSILSEFADRGDLQQFLTNPSSKYKDYRDRIIDEAANIAHALDFLHKNFHVDGNHRPCYHLDLKPANILIFSRRSYPPEKRDEIGEWVITDFGVSAFHERNVTGASKTLPRREPGTYQPPEIDTSLGSPSVNAKGDIWALGGILCMVLAFILAGNRGVEQHVQQRSFTAVGPQEQDFYYEILRQTKPKAILKRKVQAWLLEIEHSSTGMTWMIDLIRECLNVDEHERPDAISVYKSLKKPQTRPEHRLRIHPTISQSSSRPLPAANDFSQSPGMASTVRGFFTPNNRRKQSPNLNAEQSLSPAARSLSLRSSVPIGSTTTDSAVDFRLSSSSVVHLVAGNANQVAIDPGGQHIVLCFPREALVFDLVPALQQRSVAGTFEYINLAGHYLILYEKSSLQVRSGLSDKKRHVDTVAAKI